MAPLNSTLHLVSASNSAANVDTTRNPGIQVQWVPLLILALLVILIIIIIAMPKGWMIDLYDRICRTTKQGPAIASSPRRIFALFSSRNRADDQQLRIEEVNRQRRERDASFIDVHLSELRGFQKTELQKAERFEPNVLEEVSSPLPVLLASRQGT
ncbi:hypothetical protein DPSP01_013688 [Paraphaeosphaeria sporulosa]